MSSKTYLDALKQIEQMKQTAEALRKKEIQGVVKRIREAIALYNITAKELFPLESVKETGSQLKVFKPKVVEKSPQPTRRGGKPGKRAPKYSDGTNLWSGGGSTPVWLRELEKKGHNREEFRIKQKE